MGNYNILIRIEIDILKRPPLTNPIVGTILVKILFQIGYIYYFEKGENYG